MRVADFVIQYLKNKNVKNFFSVTGRGTLFLNDALAREKNVKSFFFHHEQSAAFAAITTPSANNDISCCMVSTGCASTNTITAVLSAWQDGLPVIFLSRSTFTKLIPSLTNLNPTEVGVVPFVITSHKSPNFFSSQPSPFWLKISFSLL